MATGDWIAGDGRLVCDQRLLVDQLFVVAARGGASKADEGVARESRRCDYLQDLGDRAFLADAPVRRASRDVYRRPARRPAAVLNY